MKKITSFLMLVIGVSLQVSAQLYESFEGATFPPTGWTTFIGANGAGTAQNWKSSTTYHSDGAKCAFVRWENSGSLNEDWLVTPLLNLTGTGSILTFDGRDEYQSGLYGAMYYILVSTNSQTTIADFDTIATYTESNMGPGFKSFNISLSAYSGQSVYIAFMLANNNGDSWALDNVYIGQPITCPVPNNPVFSNITAIGADVSWVSNGTGTSWQVEYGPTGFTPGAGTLANSSSTSLSLSSLTPSTPYDVYVREICGTGDTSLWRGPNSFTTLVACPVPTNPGITEISQTTAMVYWNGGTSSAWVVEWGPAGFNMATGTGPIGSINATNDTVLITGLSASTNYEFNVWTDCSSMSLGLSDTTYNVPFTTSCPTASLPYFENFDVGTGCISALNGGNTLHSWERINYYQTPSSTLDGTPLFIVSSDAAGSQAHMNEYLTTPYIDASGISGSLFLEFDQYFRPYTFGGPEKGEVEVWDGTSWNVILSMNQTSGSKGAWGAPEHRSFNITAYANDSVQVRFHYYDANWEYYWALDNIKIREINCLEPTAVAAASVGTDSITLHWNGENGLSWSIEYGPKGFTPGTGTSVLTTDTFYTFTSLNSSTVYDFYVQSECTLSQVSDTIGPIPVQTECAPYPIPWAEGLEGLNPGEIPVCMSTSGTGWVTDTLSSLTFNRKPHTGNGYIYGKWSMDGWVFSPEFYLEANKSYTFSFWYITGGGSGFQVKTAFGSLAQPDSMVHFIGTPLINPINQTYQQYTTTFSPLADGNYVIGTHLVASSSPWYLTFDDFELKENPNCAPPQPVTLSGITPYSADLEWGSNAGEWELTWGPQGFIQGSTTVAGTLVSGITGNLFTLNGLPSDSCLSIYLRSICGTDTSVWGPRLDFCTLPTCPAPAMLGLESVNTNSATIYWNTGGAAYWDISYGPIGTAPGAGIIAHATNDTMVLGSLSSGTYYEFYVRDSCGAGDLSKWAGPYSFKTECVTASLPYLETFDQNLGCFDTVIGGTSLQSWKWVANRNGTLLGSSTGFMLIDSELAGSGKIQNDYSYSPYIDASGLATTDTLILSFNQYFNDWGPGNDSANVEVWDGTQWINILIQAGVSVGSWTVPDEKKIDITAYANDSLRVRFHYRGSWDWYWAVDSVYIGISSTCIIPANVAVSNIGCTEGEVSWNSGNSGATAILEYDSAGFSAGTGTQVNGAVSPYLLSGLTPGTDYDIYIRYVCSTGDTSDWSGIASFQTAAGPLPVIGYTWLQTDTTATSGTVSFDGSSTTGADSISWDFGGTTAKGITASNLYTANGIYSVTLTAWNDCGAADSIFQVDLAGISIAEFNLDRYLAVYPNPTSERFTLRLNGLGGMPSVIRVRNSIGQLIYFEEVDHLPIRFERTIDLSDKGSGLYIIEWQHPNGVVSRRLIRS